MILLVERSMAMDNTNLVTDQCSQEHGLKTKSKDVVRLEPKMEHPIQESG